LCNNRRHAVVFSAAVPRCNHYIEHKQSSQGLHVGCAPYSTSSTARSVKEQLVIHEGLSKCRSVAAFEFPWQNHGLLIVKQQPHSSTEAPVLCTVLHKRFAGEGFFKCRSLCLLAIMWTRQQLRYE
jgi:hypothetical protein